MDGPAFERMALERAFHRQLAACIVIDKEMELGDALRDRDERKALITQRCPARNPRECASRKRAFDTFGDAQHSIDRGEQSDGG